MPAQWTGNLVGKMHNYRISNKELAEELGVSAGYVSMVLNGSRNPQDIRERMEVAVDAIIERKC